MQRREVAASSFFCAAVAADRRDAANQPRHLAAGGRCEAGGAVAAGASTEGCRGEKDDKNAEKICEVGKNAYLCHPKVMRRYCGGHAEIAQLVERNLAKVEVAGPSPVFRSRRQSGKTAFSVSSPPGLLDDLADCRPASVSSGKRAPGLQSRAGRRAERGSFRCTRSDRPRGGYSAAPVVTLSKVLFSTVTVPSLRPTISSIVSMPRPPVYWIFESVTVLPVTVTPSLTVPAMPPRSR